MNLGSSLQNKMQPQEAAPAPQPQPEQPQKQRSEIADTQSIVRRIRNRGNERGKNNYPDTSLA